MQPYFEATPGLLITEDDVRRLILRDKASRRITLPKPVKATRALSTLAIIALLTYAAINGPALWIKSSFYVRHDLFPTRSTLVTPQLPPPVPSKTETPAVVQAPKLADNYIFINRIEVSAPVIWDVQNDNDIVLRNLQHGVAQLKGTAHPGENGNVFIVGHSSNLPWASGDYKQIFALLPNLEIGDTITVTYHNTAFEYRVVEKKVVMPDDSSVLNNTGDTRLTLMTCVPIGTNLKREIIIAKPLVPMISSGSLPTTSSNHTGTLPSAL